MYGNAAQTEAVPEPRAAAEPGRCHGSREQAEHAVPDQNQVRGCHGTMKTRALHPGPKARHLNRDFVTRTAAPTSSRAGRASGYLRGPLPTPTPTAQC